MKVHIVKPYDSPAMMRMSEPLLGMAGLHEVTTSKQIDPGADVNIHIPFHTLLGDAELGNSKHIAAYTHCNIGAAGEVVEACNRADLVTAMSFTGRQELLDFGVDPRKIWVIPSAADGFSYRPRRVMIVGYPQPNGRKREVLLLDLAYQYDLTAFEFVLVGQGWEPLANLLVSMGVNAKPIIPIDDDTLETFYQSADVLLVTGYIEGGPLPLLEAMASGTRVLSPRFGYAADYLNAEDLYDTPAELMDKLNALAGKSILYHQIARSWTWRDYTAEYAMLIGRLTNSSVDLFPERAMSRYVQLLDIIERDKPKSICEIGTWGGNRAVQMLQAAGKFYPMKRLSYQGFDLFDTQTGEQFVRELSKVGYPLEVVRKRIEATRADVRLLEGETFDTIDNMYPADFYFVDGGHSEYTIENDGSRVTSYLDEYGGVAVFDDYYHENKPEGVGCNKFIDALGSGYIVNFLPVRTRASDGRLIGMVEVRRADVHLQMPQTAYSGNYSFAGAVGN